MKVPDVDSLYATVCQPGRLPGCEHVPYEYEYALWYAIPFFPMLVRVYADTPVP